MDVHTTTPDTVFVKQLRKPSRNELAKLSGYTKKPLPVGVPLIIGDANHASYRLRSTRKQTKNTK